MAPMRATQARKLIGAMKSMKKVMKNTSAVSDNTAAIGGHVYEMQPVWLDAACVECGCRFRSGVL